MHGQRSLADYRSWGHKESDVTVPLTLQFGMKGDVTLWLRPGQTTSLLMVSLETICVKSWQSSSLAQSSKLQAHTRHFLSLYKLISHVSSAIKHKSTHVIQVPSDFFFFNSYNGWKPSHSLSWPRSWPNISSNNQDGLSTMLSQRHTYPSSHMSEDTQLLNLSAAPFSKDVASPWTKRHRTSAGKIKVTSYTSFINKIT